MTRTLCFLLPATSAQDLDLFLGLPTESLLAAGNGPAITLSRTPVFRLLAPSDVVLRAEGSARWRELARHFETLATPIDDLVLDYSFEAVPSLAYWHGINASDDPTQTDFVFLQPNLVLTEGSLPALMRCLDRGDAIVNATYLRCDLACLRRVLNGNAANQPDFAPRAFLDAALKSLTPLELASIVNNRLSLSARSERFYWRHDASSLVARDFAPALLALQPSRRPAGVPGFRDIAFADALCPGMPPRYFADSDEFLGVELIEDATTGDVSVGDRPPRAIAQELSAWSTASQRTAALGNHATFHTGSLAAGVSATTAASDEWLRMLVSVMGPPQPALDHPRWTLALYLWAMRRFELAKGTLPPAPFTALLGRAEGGSGKVAGRGMGLMTLARLARGPRTLLLGRAPLVTILHPDWLDYRLLKSSLRSAANRTRAVLYVGDEAAVFGRVLGTPAFNTTELLDGTYDRRPADAGTVDTVIMEISARSLRCWAELVEKVLPAVRHGGRVMLFHHNSGAESGTTLSDALSRGAAELNRLGTLNVSVSVVGSTGYRTWLREAYPIALQRLRNRDLLGIVEGLLLFSLATLLSLTANMARGGRAYDSAADSWTSVTMAIDV